MNTECFESIHSHKIQIKKDRIYLCDKKKELETFSFAQNVIKFHPYLTSAIFHYFCFKIFPDKKLMHNGYLFMKLCIPPTLFKITLKRWRGRVEKTIIMLGVKLSFRWEMKIEAIFMMWKSNFQEFFFSLEKENRENWEKRESNLRGHERRNFPSFSLCISTQNNYFFPRWYFSVFSDLFVAQHRRGKKITVRLAFR